MRERRLIRGLPTAAIASAGVVLGHWLAYVEAMPHPRARAVVLASTGHGYWATAVKLAVVIGLAGVGAIWLRAAARRSNTVSVSSGRFGPFTWLVWRLAALQVAAFTAMEVTERLAAGAPIAPLLGRLYVVGIGVQFLVASAGAVVLVLLSRVATRVADLLFTDATPPLREDRSWRPGEPIAPVAVRLDGVLGARAPPSR